MPKKLHPSVVRAQAKKRQHREDNTEKYDIAIVGAGVAGLWAALHAGMEGKKVALIEKNEEVGQAASGVLPGRGHGVAHQADELEQKAVAESLELAWELFGEEMYQFFVPKDYYSIIQKPTMQQVMEDVTAETRSKYADIERLTPEEIANSPKFNKFQDCVIYKQNAADPQNGKFDGAGVWLVDELHQAIMKRLNQMESVTIITGTEVTKREKKNDGTVTLTAIPSEPWQENDESGLSKKKALREKRQANSKATYIEAGHVLYTGAAVTKLCPEETNHVYESTVYSYAWNEANNGLENTEATDVEPAFEDIILIDKSHEDPVPISMATTLTTVADPQLPNVVAEQVTLSNPDIAKVLEKFVTDKELDQAIDFIGESRANLLALKLVTTSSAMGVSEFIPLVKVVKMKNEQGQSFSVLRDIYGLFPHLHLNESEQSKLQDITDTPIESTYPVENIYNREPPVTSIPLIPMERGLKKGLIGPKPSYKFILGMADEKGISTISDLNFDPDRKFIPEDGSPHDINLAKEIADYDLIKKDNSPVHRALIANRQLHNNVNFLEDNFPDQVKRLPNFIKTQDFPSRSTAEEVNAAAHYRMRWNGMVLKKASAGVR